MKVFESGTQEGGKISAGKLSGEQLHIIQHSLGCDPYGRTKYRGTDEGDGGFEYSRNRYVHNPTPDLLALCEAGLMVDHGAREVFGGNYCYTVTRAGVQVMREQSPRPPRVSRGAKRYAAFRSLKDSLWPDLTFQEFLTDERTKQFREVVA